VFRHDDHPNRAPALSREVALTPPARRQRLLLLAAAGGLAVGLLAGTAASGARTRCPHPPPARILEVVPEPAPPAPPRLILLGDPAPACADEPVPAPANLDAGRAFTGNRVGTEAS
jgi:hypothetical protein